MSQADSALVKNCKCILFSIASLGSRSITLFCAGCGRCGRYDGWGHFLEFKFCPILWRFLIFFWNFLRIFFEHRFWGPSQDLNFKNSKTFKENLQFFIQNLQFCKAKVARYRILWNLLQCSKLQVTERHDEYLQDQVFASIHNVDK